MHLPSLIERKRDGGRLSRNEIAAFVAGFVGGEIPDYQVSALAMAIFFQGMDAEETSDLTRAMLQSGETLKFPTDSPPKVDKHSTGGVGDKVSLVLAPLLACDELWVPMISGRGLGFTGGTLDKLESIPGFRVELSSARVLAQLQSIGVCMIGQSADICPADNKLYALRHVTGTVPSLPLIVASIMSKKLAESLDALVLDVKFGSGAFMKDWGEAELLAASLQSVGEQMGVRTRAILSRMDQPLGHAVGNALEVEEAVRTLRGDGPQDLVDLTLDLGEKVSRAGRDRLARWLQDGTAWSRFVAMVEHQEGDSTTLEKLTSIHVAPVIREVVAPRDGTLAGMDAGIIGRAGVQLGAGRKRTSDAIDPAAGFDRILKVGNRVEKGQPLARIHARDQSAADAAEEQLLAAAAFS